MSNEKNAVRATDSDELRRRFMDPCRLGSEAEWWAKRRIEELERLVEEQDSLLQEIRPLVEKAAAVRTERDELVAALLEISQVACSLSPEQKISNAALAKLRKP